jgi:hypothetical protein
MLLETAKAVNVEPSFRAFLVKIYITSIALTREPCICVLSSNLPLASLFQCVLRSQIHDRARDSVPLMS